MNEIPATVLVVDDEIQIRRFLRTGFELDGFAVTEAETGAEALRATTLKPSDLGVGYRLVSADAPASPDARSEAAESAQPA